MPERYIDTGIAQFSGRVDLDAFEGFFLAVKEKNHAPQLPLSNTNVRSGTYQVETKESRGSGRLETKEVRTNWRDYTARLGGATFVLQRLHFLRSATLAVDELLDEDHSNAIPRVTSQTQYWFRGTGIINLSTDEGPFASFSDQRTLYAATNGEDIAFRTFSPIETTRNDRPRGTRGAVPELPYPVVFK